MKKLLTIHYRPPYRNGRSNSFGQFFIHQELNKYFDVKGISLGNQDETFTNFKIIPFKPNVLKKKKIEPK